MSANVSIQALFARLRVAHFLVYLPENGWQKCPGQAGGQIRFELFDEEDDDPYVILLPRTDQALRSSRLIQNAIHNLCGVEGRQPQEIVQDVLSAQKGPDESGAKPQSDEARADGGRVALRFRNGEAEPLTIQVASRPVENVLMPGEAIEIVCQSPEEGPIEIGVHEGSLRIADRPR